ncbi:MAG: hypothetical protein ACTHZ1_03965 [Sphingobacterium sp.]
MKINYPVPVILLWLVAFLQGAHAQEFGFKTDFFGYADNREFGADYTVPKTFFGATISPQLYFELEESHRIYGGIHFNQEFGTHSQNKPRIHPITYYNYKSDKFDFALGFIPRNQRLSDLPRIVMADTFQYDRPNVEGMYLNYHHGRIKQTVFIDWLSKQSHEHREQFLVGITGRFDMGQFYLRNDGLMYHNALTSNDSLAENLQDNGVLVLRLGADLSSYSFLDSLSIDAGAALGFDRVRSVYDLRTTTGFISEFHAGYRNFFLNNTLYLGEIMNLPIGDPFYHRKRYDRLDLGWTPFQSDRIEGRFTASFHFSPGRIDNQQMFTLRYKFASAISR